MEDNNNEKKTNKKNTWQELKNTGKDIVFDKVLKTVGSAGLLKAALIVLGVIVAIILLVAIASYISKMIEIINDPEDENNISNNIVKFNNSYTIGEDGTMNRDMTPQELWDQLVEAETNIEYYLDSPEELMTLINAEFVTKYMDTRLKPDEEINWQDYQDVNSTEIQGVIDLMRATESGEKKQLTYVSQETFQGYLDTYNETGSQDALQNALTHYTIDEKKVYGSTGTSVQNSEPIVDTGKMKLIYGGEGSTPGIISFYDNTTPEGEESAVIPKGEESKELQEGMVAVSEADLKIDFSTGDTIIYVETQEDGNGSYADGRYYYVCDSIPADAQGQVNIFLDEPNKLNDENKGTFENAKIYIVEENVTWERYEQEYKNLRATTIEEETENDQGTQNGEEDDENGASMTGGLFWPTPSNVVTSEYGYRTDPDTGVWKMHYGIDIGGNIGVDLYAVTSGIVSAVGDAGSYGYGKYLIIDHGEGYQSLYAHCHEILVNEGDTVSKGQLIALLGSTGYSTGPHIHFEIRLDGEKQNPMDYFYENIEYTVTNEDYNTPVPFGTLTFSGMHVSGTGTQLIADSVIKVAVINESWQKVESTDPNVASTYAFDSRLSTRDINYQSLVANYSMPFDYLWSWLVMTENKEFVLDLAQLAYDSKIEITLFDTYTQMQTVGTSNYTYREEVIVDGAIRLTSETESFHLDVVGETASRENNYQVETTTFSKNSSVSANVTEADIWYGKFVKEYELEPLDFTNTENTIEYDDEIANDYVLYVGEDRFGIVANFLNTAIQDYQTGFPGITGNIIYRTEKAKESILNKSIYTTTSTARSKWKEVLGSTDEKIDYNEEESNFVKLYNSQEHTAVRVMLESSRLWLFEAISANQSTAGMTDLTKYLMYLATDEDYGVIEFDMSEYKPGGEFQAVTGTLQGDTIEEQVWIALRNAGFSEIATAGAMGNIEAESNFQASSVEVGSQEGIGLCQWSFDRRDGLEAFAASRGTSWEDVAIQIEFLIAELTPGGGADGYASYIIGSGLYGYNGDDWRNATTIEDAVNAFCWSFEKPRYETAHINRRIESANAYLDQFSGKL